MISNATETISNYGFILLQEQAIDLTVCESKIFFFFSDPCAQIVGVLCITRHLTLLFLKCDYVKHVIR